MMFCKKEYIRAKGTVKELVVTVVARVERFAALGIRISEGKVKLPVTILCRVVILNILVVHSDWEAERC